MNEIDLESEIEYLQEQLGKELDTRAALEDRLKEAENILTSMVKAFNHYRKNTTMELLLGDYRSLDAIEASTKTC